MMKLTIKYDATHEVWFAHAGETENDSNWIGQGQSPEDACSDYWYQAAGKAADLRHDEQNGWWILSQGYIAHHFPSKDAAVRYADDRNWQII